MTPRQMAEPPRLARWLVRMAVPRSEREAIAGDLEEMFRANLERGAGRRRAGRAYWKEAVGTIVALRMPERETESGRKGDGIMQTLWQDVKYGVRMLTKSPAFTLVAVIALTLGIGATTAIFSVVHAVLLSPLPYEKAEQIVQVSETNLSRGWASFATAPPNFVDWKEQAKSFDGIAAFRGRAFNYTGGETPEQLRGLTATEDFFPLLRVQPAIGRGFTKEEFQEGRNRVALLTNSFWQRAFGGDKEVLGRTLPLNGEMYTVVGVLPATFTFGGAQTDLWVPLVFSAQELAGRGAHFLNVIGRMKDDATVAKTQAELGAIAEGLAVQYPNTNKNWGVVVRSLRDAVVGDVQPAILVLLAAVGLVLLIACANVANMQLARATVRAREVAIRTAVGAGRGRIIRQLLTESFLLALIGGGLGVLLATWGVQTLLALQPGVLPRAQSIGVNSTVLFFTIGVSLFTGLLFGLAPALSATRTDVHETLKEGGRSGGGGARRKLRSTFVVVQVALALVLLIGSGLLLRSFGRLQSIAPGFNKEGTLTFGVGLPQPKYPQPAQQVAFFQQVHERMASLPGVESVAMTSTIPLSGRDEVYSIGFESRPGIAAADQPSATYYLVTPGYFELMGIPVKAGRVFSEHDTADSVRVAVVNDTFARMHFPNENPVGQRIRMGRNSSLVREIVGVVGTVRHYGLGDKDAAQMYEAFAQHPRTGTSVLLRTSVDPLSLAAAARREVQGVDAQQPIVAVRTLEDYVATSVSLPRFQTVLLGIFAGVALILAAVGIYGVMSYSVTQRTQEIGIRMALGAEPRIVLGQLVREGMLLVGIGLAAGLAGAFALTGFLQTLLFGVGAHDGVTFVGVPVFLGIVALLATILPARRATRVDPLQALRYE